MCLPGLKKINKRSEPEEGHELDDNSIDEDAEEESLIEHRTEKRRRN